MTIDEIALRELLEKGSDAELPREMWNCPGFVDGQGLAMLVSVWTFLS